MKQYIPIFTSAIAVAIVFSTTSAYALDLPGEGETWTIPPNTTNVVEEADMAAYNALGKVVFADETSALRFTSATPPNVLLEGAGWMIKDYNGDWTITKQQTSAWIGTWDFRGTGTVTPDGSTVPLFAGGTGLHDVWIRSGAVGTHPKGWRAVYANAVVHVAGRLHLGGSGSTVTLRQIEVEEDGASIYCGGTVWAQFSDISSGGKLYNGGIKFNGHYLNVPSSSTYDSVLFFSDGSGKLQGPGSIRVDPAMRFGIQAKSSSSTAASCSLDITDMIVTSAVNVCNHYYN